MKIIKDIEQNSPEWFEYRLGKITASRAKDVMAKGVGKAPSKTRHAYMCQLAAERITGLTQDMFMNEAMQHGIDTEQEAVEYYEQQEGAKTEKIGFVSLNDYVGCSPDRFVDGDGLLEVKCPKTTTQIQRFLDGKFPNEYNAQVQMQLYVCDKKWCDFVSFDPRIQSISKYFKIRVFRDEEYIAKLKDEISCFVFQLQDMLCMI